MIQKEFYMMDDYANLIRSFVRHSGDFDKQNELYIDILNKTQYRLPLPAKEKETPQIIINRIREDWIKNENEWKREIYFKDYYTRCSTLRLKNGTYEYIDLDTQQAISSEEYQSRYLQYLSNIKKKQKYDRMFAPKHDNGGEKITTNHSSATIESKSSDNLVGEEDCSICDNEDYSSRQSIRKRQRTKSIV